jgi:hypothetical protein
MAASGVWIGLDRRAIARKVILPKDLTDLWHHEQAYHRRLIHGCEAAHIGDIPVSAIGDRFRVERLGEDLLPLD